MATKTMPLFQLSNVNPTNLDRNELDKFLKEYFLKSIGNQKVISSSAYSKRIVQNF